MIEEATALGLGACPRITTVLVRNRERSSLRPGLDDLRFLNRYLNLRTLTERHFGTHPQRKRITPTGFVTWLRELHLFVPPGLQAAVARHSEPLVDWQAEANRLRGERDDFQGRVSLLEATLADGAVNTSAQTRERDSLLKLVIGMACGGHGYDAKGGRSPIAGQIASDLQTRGLSLSEDTIRKYLREGADLLPRGEEE